MRKVVILGIGNVLQGDRGAACYVLESVATETSSESVHISYLGDNPSFAGGLLYMTDLAIVVGTLRVSGVPENTQGYEISKPVRGAIAMAVRRIRKELMALEVKSTKCHHSRVILSPEVVYMMDA